MKIHLSTELIESALPKIEIGLLKYTNIMSIVATDNYFYKNLDFRRKFNAFYRVRRSSETWQPAFYEIMSKAHNLWLWFLEILTELHEKTGRYEASFASKLYATIHATAPVIDSVVLSNLWLVMPRSWDSDRLRKISEIYTEIGEIYSQFLKTENGRYLVTAFRKKYPDAKVTEEKMVDLVLWQIRII